MIDKDDARVVHVYVEDQSMVQADDICEWLRIIDNIDETKMQYDVAQQKSFYWIRFKHAFAAQQAVNYLDGERLKNQVVRIRSNVYTKRQPLATNTEDSVLSTSGKEEQEQENPNLPWNYRMPPDLRMDVKLVDSIPALLSNSGENGEHHTLVHQLRQVQESYCRIQEAIKQAEEGICKTDKEIMELLQANANPVKVSAKSYVDAVENVKNVEVKKSRRIGNSVHIPMSIVDPAELIIKFTRHIGPVTDYSFSVSMDGKSFQAIVEFFHEDDAAYALRFLEGHGVTGNNTGKRMKQDLDTCEALSLLTAFGWREDASVGMLHPHDMSTLSLDVHNKAMSVLQSCLEKR